MELGCGSGLGDAGAVDIGDIFDDISDTISDAGDWISANAPGVLSVVGGAVGTVLLPGVGTAIGSSLGGAVGKAVKGSPSSGGGSVQVAPTPVQGFPPIPGIDNLYAAGFGGKIRLPDPSTPVVIRVGGWVLDPAKAQWVNSAQGSSFSAKNGDKNAVTGATYPPSSTQGVALGSILRSLANNPAIQAAAAQASGQHYQSINLAAPLEPAPAAAPKWTTTQKVTAGVGAAGLAYLVWRLAK